MKFNTRASRVMEQRPTSHHEMLSPASGSAVSVAPDSAQQSKGALLLSLMEEMQRDMQATRSEIGELRNEFQDVAAQQGVQHKVFDALHTELSDYKNDFVSARMKPMLSAMLFLYDSISGFNGELVSYVDPPDWLGEKVLRKELIQSNLGYFQEQFDEIMRMCELQPVAPEVGALSDPKTQNIISTEPTDDASLNNLIQKVTRVGWTQGEKMFRPAEVVIWKAGGNS